MDMKLIFIYNAEKGPLNSFLDFIHKSLSPNTYSCNLCSITHTFKKRKKWSKFTENFHLKIEFFYKSDLEKNNLLIFENELPCCLIEKGNNQKVLINKNDMNTLRSEDELIELIKLKVNV